MTPVAAGASVHVAGIFTTGASGLSHLRFGNVNKKLCPCLVIPESLSAVLGEYLLSDVINADVIKPFVASYLVVLDVIIIKKAFQTLIKKKKTKNIGILAVFGGFMDSIGDGRPILLHYLVEIGLPITPLVRLV